MVDKLQDVPKRVPLPVDFATAEAEYGDGWCNLPTRTRNRLAKVEMFHREYAELSAAIKGFR